MEYSLGPLAFQIEGQQDLQRAGIQVIYLAEIERDIPAFCQDLQGHFLQIFGRKPLAGILGDKYGIVPWLGLGRGLVFLLAASASIVKARIYHSQHR